MVQVPETLKQLPHVPKTALYVCAVFFCVCYPERYPFTQNTDQGLAPCGRCEWGLTVHTGPFTHMVSYGSHGAE